MVIALCLITHSGKTQVADANATTETKNLWKQLGLLKKKGLLFGHQDDMAYGVNWKYVSGRSDVKDLTGEYPAIFGWELGGLEMDNPVNLDSVPFDKMKAYICSAYNNGAAITISWHLHNPLTGKSAWDPAPSNTIQAILPGGEKNELYNSWLDKIADFFKSLKGSHGEYVPVIFRPFHELNGSWFWWGGKNCKPEEIIQLWKYSIAYLRDKKQVHQLLYAFNTDRFSSEQEYLERYPGDDWVDILGFDIYQKGDILSNEKFIAALDNGLTMLENIAGARHKIPALTEFGFNELPVALWWTEVFYKAIKNHQIAYALAWRNAGKKSGTEMEYYVPYPQQLSANNFLKFHKLSTIFFENKVRQLKLYK